MTEPSLERQQEIQRTAERLMRIAGHLAKGEFVAIRDSKELGLHNVVDALLLGSVDISQGVIKLATKKTPDNITNWSSWQMWQDFVRLTKNHFDPPLYWSASVLQLLLESGFEKDDIVKELAPRAHVWVEREIWNAAAKKVYSGSDDWMIYPKAVRKLQ